MSAKSRETFTEYQLWFRDRWGTEVPYNLVPLRENDARRLFRPDQITRAESRRVEIDYEEWQPLALSLLADPESGGVL